VKRDDSGRGDRRQTGKKGIDFIGKKLHGRWGPKRKGKRVTRKDISSHPERK